MQAALKTPHLLMQEKHELIQIIDGLLHVRLCGECSRCRFFSVSTAPDAVDCSWYHACDLARTRELNYANFVSMSLESAREYSRMCRARYGEAAC